MPKASEIPPFDYREFIAKHGGRPILEAREKQIIYAQGESANSIFYLISGTAEMVVNSAFGKEAVIALLHAGDFFGEGCLDGQSLRTSTIVAMTDCKIAQFEKPIVKRAISDDFNFAMRFMTFLVERNELLKAELIDRFFSSGERRLARILLALAGVGEKTGSLVIIPTINQDLLAKIVGTSRPRINGFMNKFRALGYIDYNGEIKVHNSLFKIITSEKTRKVMSDNQAF
jgi:CRP/FNR family cyclic AMP-dependent transcriptional regulator